MAALFQLEPLVTAYYRRLGIEPGVLTHSAVVGASGWLSPRGSQIEISVSPQDAAGEFLGGSFSAASFRLSDVMLTPLGGGAPIPLSVGVARVDASARQTVGSAAVLLFDSSGSMRGNDPGAEGRLAAARALLDEVQGSLDIGILDFGAGSNSGLSASRVLQIFTRDRALHEAALKQLRDAGGTPLYEAINDALTLLERERRTGAIVVLTDGQAGGAHQETIDRANALGIPLYSVGLGRNLDFNALRGLGVETGGFFVEADQRETLAAAFRGIGTGISVGKVRVFAEGPAPAGLTKGPAVVSGKVITSDPASKRAVEQPFRFNTQVAY